jgi:hypothetical protein
VVVPAALAQRSGRGGRGAHIELSEDRFARRLIVRSIGRRQHRGELFQRHVDRADEAAAELWLPDTHGNRGESQYALCDSNKAAWLVRASRCLARGVPPPKAYRCA